ncbi:hypothetical protein A2V49_00750 [candidate division WWE3 bacterium RBG_19FT_COMBO_34_6]|uniref:ABC transporter permease n=1 Tax=candidate division WWE3 bacterium RBG_19FT_COMBO_34_6 TaxID=1802612 RepID=A0A1F4UK78_UNCKA|nr:MAG: hypothetical protein A2V49_00750 [candidate division WWE3 bacterium RBG_19FT_COMBO_34_6]
MNFTIKDHFNLLKANALNSYRVQTAYFFENWASLASTLFYVLTMVLFVKILYSNIKTFAGYTEAEMLFLMLISQLNFYVDWSWNTNNIMSLIESVRTGEMDIILSKPLPTLFYVTFRDIILINRVKDGVPNLLIMAFLVKWSEIHTNWILILISIVIFICGQIAWHCFRFIFALPVFFIGQSYSIYSISGTLGETQNIPLEGFRGKLRDIFVSAVPSLITAQMSVSVILGKSNPITMLIIAIAVASIFLILKSFAWIISLKNYSSASS